MRGFAAQFDLLKTLSNEEDALLRGSLFNIKKREERLYP